MRDHVTEELISAYVDGELARDELKLVEQLLAESSEHRQLLAEFQAMRASMWDFPSVSLPADFHTRVMTQIGELKVVPSKELVQRAGRTSKTRPWQSVFFAAASLAGVIALTVMLGPPMQAPRAPGSQSIRTVPVYLRAAPTLVMVYDVTVTRNGQKTKAVEKLLRMLGINIDPGQRLNPKIEGQLRAIRESERVPGTTEVRPYATDPATPKSADKDEVEMLYMAGKLATLDQFGMELARMGMAGEGVAELHYDLVEETDKLGVMHRLHNSAREHYAKSKDANPSATGVALSFHIELKRISIPGVAAFPTLMLNAKAAGPTEPVAHILLIIRNVDANADDTN
ncbi:MAG: RseA family anti-sigma factor [Planctomycetota bacterium]